MGCQMGFFKDIEEKAARRYNKTVTPSENSSNRMIKRQEASEEDIQVESLFKEKEKKLKNKDNENYMDDFFKNDFSDEDSLNLYPAQRPESFHFFILENQYQDLERLIRGVKDVWDKDRQKWVIKRKAEHCFTDEESEEIVRTAQSHLSSDIKLATFSREEYPIIMNNIFQQIWILFKEIMDYRYGRFGNITKQMNMKQQAVNIFNVLMMRIKANYSRAVEGRENKATHDSVKGQESLQQTDRKNKEFNY
jgi:hypothetical protein